MNLKQGAKRSSVKRGLRVLGLSSSMLFGTAALAGGVSIVYASLQMPESLMASWLVRPLAAIGVVTVGSSTTVPVTIGSTTSVTDGTATPTPTPTPAANTSRGVKVGINLAKPFYWNKSRAFSNLLGGDNWRLKLPGVSKAVEVPADQLDADRYVARLNDGEKAFINLSVPSAINKGKSVDILCRWTGEGVVEMVKMTSVKNVSYAADSLRFTWVPGTQKIPNFQINSLNPTNPIKAVDCREATADPNALFDPVFVANVKKYNTSRFMWWQRITTNAPVTWAGRTKPDMPLMGGVDGVAIEHMIKLANQTKTNPWFCMPWNADEEYIRRFAEMVRDRLDPTLVAYVEVSNEVWNSTYSVTKQAIDEGTALGMSKPLPQRLAQKTSEVMTIWTDVFSGQMSRIVRVVAGQHTLASRMKAILAYGDVAQKVDAIATAPYFPYKLDNQPYDPNDLTSVFAALRQVIDERMDGDGMEIKALATQYNLRFIGYEGGQHVAGDDIDTNLRIQRDPRMGQLYSYYLDRWKAISGDLMVLFEDVDGAPGSWGAFGMQDYPGQPLTEAPKANATHLFIASINNK